MSNILRVLFVHFRSSAGWLIILLFPVSESAADGVIHSSKRWGRNPIIGNPWEKNKKKIQLPFFFDMITLANKRFAVRTFR